MDYAANKKRYDRMPYRRCGKSGVLLPAMSLGLWQNFGAGADYAACRGMVLGAFDRGVTHFDLANNYGPPPGSAEETFGRVLREDLHPWRDELFIATKAGYHMWPGPYGEWGSRKQLISSLDQSLGRLGIEYVDLFYHHRPDPDTPLEETMDALAHIVHSGKALYVGISNYSPEDTLRAVDMLANMGIHCLIHQMRYSMLDRANEAVLEVTREKGVGNIAFSPLAQGLLTGKYINGVPQGSRAASGSTFLTPESIDHARVGKTRLLGALAAEREQSLAQMALAWVLREGGATSVVLGASRLDQIEENLVALDNLEFSPQEQARIEDILK